RVRTCALAVQRCYTPCAHVRTCRAALLHTVCARAHLPCSIATHRVRTCALAVQHCYTPGAHVRTCRAALLHTVCARAHLACGIAARLGCSRQRHPTHTWCVRRGVALR